MDNWIELEAPNGEWVEFNIAGEQPTEEELNSFNKILTENYSEKNPLRTENNPISSVKSSIITDEQNDDKNLDMEYSAEKQSDKMQEEQLDFLVPDAPTDNAPISRLSPSSYLSTPVTDDTINNQALNVTATAPNQEPKEIAPEVMSEVQPLSDPSENNGNIQEASSAIEPVSTEDPEQLEEVVDEDVVDISDSTEEPEPIPDLKIPTLELYNSIDAFVEDEDARLAAKKELYMTYASHPDAKVLRNNNGDIISIEYINTVVPEPAEGFIQEADGFL